MKERTSFSVISRSIQRRGNVETGRKERVLSTGYTRKSTVTELIILASTRPQTNPPVIDIRYLPRRADMFMEIFVTSLRDVLTFDQDPELSN